MCGGTSPNSQHGHDNEVLFQMPQAGATELGLPSQEQSHPQHGFAEPTSMEESNIMRDSDSDSHSINQIRAEIEGSNLDPKRIVMRSPKERFKLSYIDTMCLIINRIIGTGIFVSPGKTLAYTTSVGASLLLWVFGIFYALAGAHVYTELGLSIPRYIIDNVEQSVPRSGGDLNYLQYIYRKPAYRPDTVVYMPVLFGISFICLGNMAGNSIHFAEKFLDAINSDRAITVNNDAGRVRGIAVGIAFFACFIHAFSRRGGIVLNNLFAAFKIGILLLIIFTTIVVAAGGIKFIDEMGNSRKVQNVWPENASISTSFANANENANHYALAFLSIIFACSGFDQANYVLGEIERPRKKFPISLFSAVSLVGVLYMAVNICYLVVVPQVFESAISDNPQHIAEQFFLMTFGRIGGEALGRRLFSAFLAVSSAGNIIVMTYTAARMKQEIAKEGFLPFSKFFAQSRDWSLGRLLFWLESTERMKWLTKWLIPENHSEPTPVGALILHLLSCIILIFATWNLSADAAYTLLSGFISYLVTAFFGFLLSLGLLKLRIRGPCSTTKSGTNNRRRTSLPNIKNDRISWRQATKGKVNPIISVVCALVYMVGNAWPLVVTWIPPETASEIAYWVMPTISFCVLGFATLWYLGFLSYAHYRRKRDGTVFSVSRDRKFHLEGKEDEEQSHHPDHMEPDKMVLLNETVYHRWKAEDAMGLMERASDVREYALNKATDRPTQSPQGYNNFDHLGL